MSKTKTNPKALPVAKDPSQTTEQALARAAVNPSINSAAVMGAYQGSLMGNTLDMGELVNCLRESCESVKSGDLSDLEAMLVTQATTLQTVFSSLARRAANQEHLRQYETFMGLALKAQAQSRATFVKQANIAHGPQQINNGTTTPGGIAHAGEKLRQSNELLEDQSHGSAYLDTRATTAPAGGHPTMATLEPIHRAKKPRRKSSGGA